MNNLQIVVPTPKLPSITFDFEKAKEMLSKEVQIYKTLVVTEDTIPSCKKSRAELNKIKTGINSDKKRIKKDWNAPYIEFEDRVKELMGMCDEGLQYLDTGLNVYEEKRIEEKTNECNELLKLKEDESELSLKFKESLHLPEGFANVSMKINAISSELDIQILNLTKEQEQEAKDIQTAKDHIVAMNTAFNLKTPLTESEFERQLEAYEFNLSFLLEDITNRAKSRQIAENKVVEEIEEVTPKPIKIIKTIPKAKDEPIEVRTLDISCSQQQYNSIIEYLESNEIEFKEITPF